MMIMMTMAMKLIHDSNGAAYQIENEDRDTVGPVFQLKIHPPAIRSSWIGRADFLWMDEATLKLADIKLNPEAVIHFRKFRLLWIFSPISREDRNCQRIRLGTQLLKHSLECVKAMGVKRVWGNITRDDYQKNPKLPKWYAGFGFEVKLNEKDFGEYAKIELTF